MEGRIVITVVGSDEVGIVAKVSNVLSDIKVNIIDITQTIFEGDIFAMIMLADISKSDSGMEVIKEELKKLEDKLNVKIYTMHENIFKKMHRI